MRAPVHLYILMLWFLGYGEALALCATLAMIGEYAQALALLGSLFQPLVIGYHD